MKKTISSPFLNKALPANLPQKAWQATMSAVMSSFLDPRFFSESGPSTAEQSSNFKALSPPHRTKTPKQGEPSMRTLSTAYASSVTALKILARRPSRILKKPQPLIQEGDFLFHKNKNSCWKAVSWYGPERLQGEWWQPSRHSRNYYRVSTDNGQELWVFEVPGMGYYLHGFFD